MMNISDLDWNIKMIIYSYTDEYTREICKKRGFYKLASFSNYIFPRNFVRYCSTIDYRTALKLWSYEKRDNTIRVNKKNYKRPSINFSSNPENDYKDMVFPCVHQTSDVWRLNNLKLLGSYCHKVTEMGFTVIVFIKKVHLRNFKFHFRSRLVDHMCDEMENDYIEYLSRRSEVDGIDLDCRKIICLPYSTGIVKSLQKKINNFESVYILSPKDLNSKCHRKLNTIKKFVSGSGYYNILSELS